MNGIKQKFTLIEVLVAMGVFMVGIAPLLGVLASTTRNYQGEVKKSNISHFVREKMIEFREGAVPSASHTTYQDCPVHYKNMKYKVELLKDSWLFKVVRLEVLDTEKSGSGNLNCFNYIHILDQ